MRTTLISKGRVIDPARDVDTIADVLIKGDQIAAVGAAVAKPAEVDDVIDARGMIVCPGLIDVHVHLRQPGHEKAETVTTGARAAIAGGFTTIACMPDTQPAIESESTAEYILLLADRAALANVHPIGTCTKARGGRELAEIGVLRRAGAVALSDAMPMVDAGVLYRVLTYASMFDLPVMQHAEDPSLGKIGGVNAGYMAAKLGLGSSPAAAEEGMVARDIVLAKATRAHLHFSTISTRGAVELIRRAKADGVRVTCEATPHHLTLTDDCIETFDPNRYKVSPPLRTRDDIDALIAGLKDGTIDCIASDHAPCTVEEKELEFESAPTGVVGLETTLGVLATELVHSGKLSWTDLLRALTVNPARLLHLEGKADLAPGSDADITVIDPEAAWTVDPTQFRSKGRNTPFTGRALQGRARYAITRGRVFDCFEMR